MSYITLKCKNCGSSMSLNTDSHSATCTHCGSTFLLADLLDEKDIEFTQKLKPKNLEQKMLAGDCLKQGETYLFQGAYDKAEASFKKAIQYDDKNYRAYLGVVKSKTQNLNVIPDSKDYVEYEKYALSLAEGEDLTFLKSELAKLELLQREKNRQTKVKQEKLQIQENNAESKRRMRSFVTKMAILVCIIFALAVILGTKIFNFSGGIKEKISVSSATELSNVLRNRTNFNIQINLEKDIDFNEEQIAPFCSLKFPFTGIFNGNGHKVSNLKIVNQDKNNTNYVGIFQTTRNAKFINVVFDNINIFITSEDSRTNYVSDFCGIVAGSSVNSEFEKVEVTNNCKIDIDTKKIREAHIGGLVGSLESSSTIENVSINTDITAKEEEILQDGNKIYIGGVVGYMSNSKITKTNCNSEIHHTYKSSHNKLLKTGVGGIAGCSTNSSITNGAVQKSMFSGIITNNLETSNYECSFSGIIGLGSNASDNAGNYCYYLPTRFYNENSSVTVENFDDYSVDSLFVKYITDDSIYTSKIKGYFESSDWNLTDFVLSLKHD